MHEYINTEYMSVYLLFLEEGELGMEGDKSGNVISDDRATKDGNCFPDDSR